MLVSMNFLHSKILNPISKTYVSQRHLSKIWFPNLFFNFKYSTIYFHPFRYYSCYHYPYSVFIHLILLKILIIKNSILPKFDFLIYFPISNIWLFTFIRLDIILVIIIIIPYLLI